jgi:glycosyltransferase involved in cell wall biosynthesis
MSTMALYTAVYPGAVQYLDAWYASVQAQADRDFDLWISLDGLTEAAIAARLGERETPTFVVAEPGSTPAQVRQQALARISGQYDAVVLVDSDDLLHPDRVGAARAWLEGADVAACGLRLVDEAGRPLGMSLTAPGEREPESVLPRTNAFGLSNTAYRSDVLRACLPIPAAAALVDWYLVTMAWLQGARLAFDPAARMDYRQHGANMARIRSPFTPERVRADTALVRQHFRLVLDSLPPGALPERATQVRQAAADVAAFDQRVVQEAACLARYVQQLNAAPPPLLWWASVAHPPLRSQWSTRKEPT